MKNVSFSLAAVYFLRHLYPLIIYILQISANSELTQSFKMKQFDSFSFQCQVI